MKKCILVSMVTLFLLTAVAFAEQTQKVEMATDEAFSAVARSLGMSVEELRTLAEKTGTLQKEDAGREDEWISKAFEITAKSLGMRVEELRELAGAYQKHQILEKAWQTTAKALGMRVEELKKLAAFREKQEMFNAFLLVARFFGLSMEELKERLSDEGSKQEWGDVKTEYYEFERKAQSMGLTVEEFKERVAAEKDQE